MSWNSALYKRFFFFALTLAFTACGAKKGSFATTSETGSLRNLSAKSVIKNHYAASGDFKTLSGKMKIDYKSGSTSQGIPATFRMERDKTLWISVFFGMGKALITPNKIAFYSSVNNLSFEGDFAALSDFFGTPLDFNMLQGLLLGEAALDLKKQRFNVESTPQAYRLKPQKALALFKLFVDIDPQNFKVAQTQISQGGSQNNLRIQYPSYTEMDGLLLPSEISVSAQTNKTETTVGISYKNISVNRALSFPFKMPKGLKTLALKSDTD